MECSVATTDCDADAGAAGKLLAVPYVRQLTDTTCGAAALAMVLSYWGFECDQESLWESITLDGRWARTNLLCRRALEQGLHGLIMQCRNPWTTLRRCADLGIPAILSHRVRWSSLSGHYSVLVGVEDEQVIVHDPFAGAGRAIGKPDFLDMWSKGGPRSRIAGHVLVALARQALPAPACSACGSMLPESVECLNCRQLISLALGGLMGCSEFGCSGRIWKKIHCPYCDAARRDLRVER